MHTMAQTQARCVLCVRSLPSAGGGFDPARLAQKVSPPLKVDSADNVYVALAKLVRSGGQAFRAVFVQTDELLAEELEFFSQTARLFPGLPVYVHAATPAGHENIPLAMAMGARGQASADNFRELWEALDAPGPERITFPLRGSVGRGPGEIGKGAQHTSRSPAQGWPGPAGATNMVDDLALTFPAPPALGLEALSPDDRPAAAAG